MQDLWIHYTVCFFTGMCNLHLARFGVVGGNNSYVWSCCCQVMVLLEGDAFETNFNCATFTVNYEWVKHLAKTFFAHWLCFFYFHNDHTAFIICLIASRSGRISKVSFQTKSKLGAHNRLKVKTRSVKRKI